MSGLFINYRGEDSDTAAALIDQELTARFGSDQVFLDCRSIPAGVDFVEELLERLRACSVLLVVIGPRWLTLTDAAGRRRIDDPQDWTRREISEALTLGLPVIPVLTGNVALPVEADLPADIAGLSRRQYVPLRRRYISVDLTFLVKQIMETDPELARIAAKRRVAHARRRNLLLSLIAASLLGTALFVYTRFDYTPHASAPGPTATITSTGPSASTVPSSATPSSSERSSLPSMPRSIVPNLLVGRWDGGSQGATAGAMYRFTADGDVEYSNSRTGVHKVGTVVVKSDHMTFYFQDETPEAVRWQTDTFDVDGYHFTNLILDGFSYVRQDAEPG